MSERLSAADVAKVARMARLNISAADVARYTQQLDGMLDHFADIDNLQLADVQPMIQPFPLVNVLRADVEQPCLDREEVLIAAPAAEQGRFRVPPSGGEDE